MAYTAGDTILDDEYNTFVNSSSSPYGYNHFAGTGSGEYGLGQTHIPLVSGGSTTITASHWNTLLTAMDNIANHTNDSITSRTQVTAGDTIAIKAAVEADLATLAASIAGGCVGATSGLTEGSEQVSSVSSTRWNGNHITQHSCTFSNNNDLRHFFNAGGKFRIAITRNGDAGAAATDKDTSMDQLITATGNVDLGAQVTTRSGSGETLTTAGNNGVADLTSTYQTILHVTQDDGSYSGNMSIKYEAKVNNNNYTDATVVTVRTTLDDAETGGDAGTGLDFTYTSGNTGTIDQYANFIGQTDVAVSTVNPNTSAGLASVVAEPTQAEVSNDTTGGA